MKVTYLLPMISIFFSLSIYAQDTTTFYFDKDWNTVSDIEHASFYRKAFKDSNNVWMAYDYYKNGNLQMKSPYKSKRFKKKQGKAVFFYESGKRKSEVVYENDLSTGKFRKWYETGEIGQKGFYDKGRQTGLWQGWYKNGKLSFSKTYENGKTIGTWEYYYQSGELKEKNSYVNSITSSCEGFYENGILHYSGNIENGLKSGKWTYWNNKGHINSEGNFKYGLKDGKWTRYFVEEKLELNYKYGQLQDQQFGGMVHDN